jgi:hypothetical protein
MSPEQEQIEAEHKEVYAQFGAVAGRVAAFEASLIMILLLDAKRSGKATTPENFDTIEQELEDRKTTLGQILGKVKSAVTVPADVENLMNEALKRRNRLMHSFFRDNASEFATAQGRQRMLDQLKEAHAYMLAAYRLVDDFCRRWAAQYGITPEAVAAEAEALREAARTAED